VRRGQTKKPRPGGSPGEATKQDKKEYDMNTSDILNKAADLIEKRGWATGNYGRANLERDDRPVCLEGAIAAALGHRAWTTAAYEATDPSGCLAARAVSEYVGHKFDRLWEWNDAKENAEAREQVAR
jgi:hypothetical protein